MYFLTIPLTVTAITIFFSLYLFKNNPLPLIISLLISSCLSLFFIKNYFTQNLKDLKDNFSLKNLPQFLMILVLILLLGRVLSPMVTQTTINNFTLLEFNGLGDYYKHLYTMVPMIGNGIPPQHPYFPPETMSYYFGFYTIPAASSIIFSLPPTITLFIYVLLVYLVAFILLISIFNKYLKSALARMSSLLLLITGVGVDVIPISAVVTKDPTNIIFNQTFLSGAGTQVINIYTTFLQSPQHFLAAVLTFFALHHLIKEKPRLFIMVPIITYIILSSVFISITLFLWLALAFIFYKHLRFTLIKAGVLCTLLLIPYFLVLTSRQNILFFHLFQPYNFFALPGTISYLVNSIVTLFLQYGPILFLIPIIFVIKKWYKLRDNLILFIGILLPFVLTWFIKSPDFNDFAMRTTVPSQMLLAAIFIYFISKSRGYLQKMLILILIPTILLGTFSFYYEYQKAWRNRKVIDPKTSELLLKVRELPSTARLAAIEKEDWVYYIPPLGFKHILNPHLREASVSTTSNVGKEHGEYEVMAFNIFLNATVGTSQEDIVNKRKLYFSQMKEYFQKYSFDLLLMDNGVWVKKSKNPYTELFHKLIITSSPITPNFTAFEHQSLLDKLSTHTISVSNKPITITINDQKLPLEKGFWFLVSCKNGEKSLKLELEDYHLLFNHHFINSTDQCVGNIFYLPEKENLQLSNTSNVTEILAYPLEIR